MITRSITSLTQLRAELSRLDPSGNWVFRGQADASWGLVPSIYRGIDKLTPPYSVDDAEWMAKIERDIYRQFEQQARQYQETKTRWELLALAQHYGTPTRLLDWTRNASIAAYFAVATPDAFPAAVWCMNLNNYTFPAFLGRIKKTYAHRVDVINAVAGKRQPSFFQQVSRHFAIGPGPRSTPLLPDPVHQMDSGFLVILDPPAFDTRLRAQDGLFTLYYSFEDYDLVWNLSEHISDVERATTTDILWKLEIPEGTRETLRSELETHDRITWHRLFPDLVGLGQSLTRHRSDEFVAASAVR